MGAERKSAVISEKEKRATAYHESGHALVAIYTEGATPLHKVTCMPRGHSLGAVGPPALGASDGLMLTVALLLKTHFLPSEDRVSRTFKEYCAELDVAMGGRVAEEISELSVSARSIMTSIETLSASLWQRKHLQWRIE